MLMLLVVRMDNKFSVNYFILYFYNKYINYKNIKCLV